VVGAVANQVGQRVDDLFDDALVQLGRLADHFQLDVFAQFRRQIAQHAGIAVEDERHRNHPDRQHRLLQMAGAALQVRDSGQQPLVLDRIELLGLLRQHRLGDHQLADQVDELIDLAHRHAQRGRFRLAGGTIDGLFSSRRLGRSHRRRRPQARGVDEEAEAVALDHGRGRFDGRLRVERRDRHLVAGNVEGEQFDEFGVGRCGDDLVLAHPGGVGLTMVERLERAERWHVAEQLGDVVGHGRVGQGADANAQMPQPAAGCGGLAAAAGEPLHPGDQFGRVGAVVPVTLTVRQLRAQGIARLQQHVDHFAGQRKLLPAHAVQEGLELVRQQRDVRKAERRGTALDRVRETEDGVELFLADGRYVQCQEHPLHVFEVFGRLFEKDDVEL
jgi:hypothetical protein